MPSNTIDVEFKRYYSLLNHSQKESIVKLLKSFVQSDKETGSSIEDYNADIDRAIAEYERGEVLPHDEVVNMAKKW
jgi:hypothetical protein